jgi:hypothetical protein
MKYLNKNSLVKTIDNVSEALLYGNKIDKIEKQMIADFIVYQHTQPRAYAGTFAPTLFDLERDLILFTGEIIKTNGGKCHMIGEEASRILRKLNLKINRINIALQEADTGLRNRISLGLDNPRYVYGKYCCKSCSCSLWLNLASGGLGNDTKLLISGLDYLKQHREDNGSWKGFPYYYTLYVLNEIQPDLAMNEIKHTAASAEKRLLKKYDDDDKYILRRRFILENILHKANSK